MAIYWDFENLHANLVDQMHGQGAYQASRFRQQEEMINNPRRPSVCSELAQVDSRC